jgi:hypothetical protein
MKKIILYALLSTFALANMHFEKNKKCSECHPTIYEEYKTSQHAKATIFKDPIHGAVYDLHPQKNKKEKYRCGTCHTPTADNLQELLTPHNGVIPDATNETQNEAVACAYCHRIEDVTSGVAMNKNVISKETKLYFSNKDNHGKSPFHRIKTHKSIYKDGKMCMGCHAHKSNRQKFEVCSTSINQKAPKKNCIECHMHQVEGAPSTMSKSTTHTFHGFPGLHGDLTNLSQYIGMGFKVDEDKRRFEVSIDHDVPHASLLHPLRAGKLEVIVTRDGKETKMQTRKIIKKIGTEGKPSAPWLATQIVHDTTIPANTKMIYPYAWDLQSGDVITATLGYFLVKPKALKKFDLQESDEATKFRVIKKESFTVK